MNHTLAIFVLQEKAALKEKMLQEELQKKVVGRANATGVVTHARITAVLRVVQTRKSRLAVHRQCTSQKSMPGYRTSKHNWRQPRPGKLLARAKS